MATSLKNIRLIIGVTAFLIVCFNAWHFWGFIVYTVGKAILGLLSLRDRETMKLLITLILFVAASAPAQQSVSQLARSHASALESYLSKNKNLTFRQEHNLSDEYLKDVRKWMGRNFKPNYAVGDFNRDRFKDFAVLLYREGEPEKNEGITSEEHATDYPLRLVVFNGSKSGFRVAYTKDLYGPPAAFIAFDKQLYYAVFESDADTFILAPAGRGYIMEFEKPR